MRRFRWCAVALLAAGCQCGGIAVEDAGFVCASDADCLDGFACIKLRCKPVGTDGGETDGGKDGGVCADGGTPKTEVCNNGLDDDCDGKIDCFDSMCLGSGCASHGKVCFADAGCACGGGGGPIEATETSCGDGFDNDCDGKTDCADSDCHCETNCSDGIDNDNNGKTDCEDSNCLHQSCTTDGGHVCCGNLTCVDLTTSDSNCGGCGLACTNNKTCQRAGLTGRCSCQGSAVGCPGNQKCSGGLCDCDFNSDCANGETCNGVSCEY